MCIVILYTCLCVIFHFSVFHFIFVYFFANFEWMSCNFELYVFFSSFNSCSFPFICYIKYCIIFIQLKMKRSLLFFFSHQYFTFVCFNVCHSFLLFCSVVNMIMKMCLTGWVNALDIKIHHRALSLYAIDLHVCIWIPS